MQPQFSAGVVYLVTQEDLSPNHSTLEIVEAAIRGGVDIVQLREKHRSARERYTLGRELRTLTAEAGVTFIVNDRIDLARAVDADGVHLGANDLPIEVAREQLGADAIVGRSVSTAEDARWAADAGANYLGVGSIFRTDSKDTAPEETAIGLDRLGEIREATACPIVGIGGITVENAGEVIAAGADGVAVISAITAAGDPERATQRFSATVRNR